MFNHGLIDIIIDGDKICPVRQMHVSTRTLESQIKNLRYKGGGKSKSDKVENAQLPPFIQAFYYYFYKNESIPDENTLFHYYIDNWSNGTIQSEVIEINGTSYKLEDLHNRHLRSYPSFIRDLHFYFLLKDSGLFNKVCYSLHADYFDGLDLQVIYKGQVYYLSIFIHTQRAEKFKRKKSVRHNYNDVSELCLNVEFADLQKTGDIYLLTTEHVKAITEMIESNK